MSRSSRTLGSALLRVRALRCAACTESLCCLSRTAIWSRTCLSCWPCSLFFLAPSSIKQPLIEALWASQRTEGEVSEDAFSLKYWVREVDNIETSVELERRESLSFQLLVRWGRVGKVNWTEIGAWSEMDAKPILAELLTVVYSGVGMMCFRKVGVIFIFVVK